MKPYHRNPKPGDKMRIGLSISKEAFETIGTEAMKHGLTKVKMVDVMVKFYTKHFLIFEQLSLSSKGIK